MQKFSAYQQYGFDLIEYKYKRERKVNIKKLTSYLCILSLLFSVCTFSTTADNNQYRENLLNYYAAFLDGTYEQLSDLVSETPSDKLNLAAISIIQGLCNEWQQKYPQRAENEIELDLDEYAEAFGLDLSLIESHAAVLNANYYKEVYDVFNARKAGDSDARLDMFTAQQAPEITPFSLPSSLNMVAAGRFPASALAAIPLCLHHPGSAAKHFYPVGYSHLADAGHQGRRGADRLLPLVPKGPDRRRGRRRSALAPDP